MFVSAIAEEYRRTFHKDVVVDLVCFRRLGHNEQDEPFVTQPLMYKKIAQHPGTRKLYADKLEQTSVVTAGTGDELVAQRARRARRGQEHQPEDPLRPEARARDRLGAVHRHRLAPSAPTAACRWRS